MYKLIDEQHEIFREIRRGKLRQDEATRGVKQLNNENRLLQEAAAHIFAGINGWDHNPAGYGFCLHDLSSGRLQSCRLPIDASSNVLCHPLMFIDQAKRPAAIVGQSYYDDRVEIEQIKVSYGLEVHTPPAYYASIFHPGACNFNVFTLPNLSLKWLPEQMEHDGPFAVDDWEAPMFRNFVEQFETNEDDCSAFIGELRRFSGFGGRWAPPKEIVSKSHLCSYIYNLHVSALDYEVAEQVWSLFELWRKEQVSAILQFNAEVLEIAP